MLGEQVFLYRRDETDQRLPLESYSGIQVVDTSRDPAARELTENLTGGDSSLYPVLRIGGDRIVAVVFRPGRDLFLRLIGEPSEPDSPPHLPKPKVYHAGDCLGCEELETWLKRRNIDFEMINIGLDTPVGDRIAKWSGGRRVVPTIDFPGVARLFDPPMDLLARLVGS